MNRHKILPVGRLLGNRNKIQQRINFRVCVKVISLSIVRLKTDKVRWD